MEYRHGIDARAAATGSRLPVRPHRSRTLRPRARAVAVAVLAALTAGTLAGCESAGPPARPDARAPFAAALLDLALRPAVGYRDPTDGTGVTVTASGSASGTVAVSGTALRVLRTGDATYARLPDPVPAALGGSAMAPMAGRWVTGLSGEDDGSAPASGQSPQDLADHLFDAFNRPGTALPDPSAPPVRLDGLAALRARTTSGDLYVTAATPHRVMRFVPRGAPGTLAAARTPARAEPAALRSGPALPAALPALATAPQAFTIAPLDEPAARTVRADIRSRAQELSRAVDAGVSARLDAEPALDCSASGCTVSSRITAITPNRQAAARIRDGRVNVEFTAAVTVEGRPAGTCSATATMSVSAPRPVQCADTAAGPVVARQLDTARRAAEAQARATGRSVPYTVHTQADTTLQVLASVDTTALTRALADEDALGSAPSPYADIADQAAPRGTSDDPKGCLRLKPPGAARSGDGWLLNTTKDTGPFRRTAIGKACLKNPPKTPKSPLPDPPGYDQAKNKLNLINANPATQLARCHTLAGRFGGPNKVENLSPCGQRLSNNNTNEESMGRFETMVATRVTAVPTGTVYYIVEPLYRSATSSIPLGYYMTAVFYDPAGIPVRAPHLLVANRIPDPRGSGEISLAN
ncbi:hypothetical protein [Kitasatospora sp. NPDC088134]|uniref:hypothetical protein n=1 Tax=Kitasatospora sp. NPDC088134 TaxID=3364071 RepID=UPI00380DEF49